MPASMVKTKHQEDLWEKAKEIVREQYGLTKEDGRRFYKLVMGIYQRMIHKGWGDGRTPPIPEAVKPGQRPDEYEDEEGQETQNATGLSSVRDLAKSERDFLDADIDDEEEGIKEYEKQIRYYEKRGQHKKAAKIRHIMEQEKEHKRALEEMKKGFWLPIIKSVGEHWITIHPHGKDYVNPVTGEKDYRRVLIDSSGRIVGGSIPKEAHGKHITSWWKKKGKPEPKLYEHLRGYGVAFTHHTGVLSEGHLETGHGYRESINKRGYLEAEPGHVAVDVSPKIKTYFVLDSAFADKDKIKALGAKYGPQLGDNFPKKWYLPIEKLPKLLKEMPHAYVSRKAIERYEEWAAANDEPTAEIKKVEQAAAKQAQQESGFEMPSGMKREAMTHGDLHPYQKEGVQFLLSAKRAILGHGVGLGKTIQAITAARIAQQKENAGTFLILCPSSRKYGWQDEIKKFSDASSVVLDASLSPKKQAERWAQIEKEKPDFVITNYEALQKPEVAERLRSIAPNVIADEGHKVKNSKAKTTKGFKLWDDAKYAWLLTATPFPNGAPAETFTMLNHVAPGIVGNWKQFLRNYAVTERVRTSFGIIEKPVALKNINELRQKVKKVVQIRSMTDPDIGLQLPDRRRVDVSLDMTKQQQAMYDKAEAGILAEINAMGEEEFRRSVGNVLTKLKRLEQIALDPDLVLPEDKRTGELSPKEQWAVETISQHLETPENRGIVVFCDFRLPLDKIADALSKEGIESRKITGSEKPMHRQETVRMFTEGKVRVVLATFATEEGINLQYGGHTLIHLDVPWVPKSITQREGRIHRQGQKNPFTTHYHVAMRETVEQSKQGTLHSKASTIDKLLGTHESENMAVGRALSRDEVLQMLGGKKKVKKSLATYTPVPNIVWSILCNAGYNLRMSKDKRTAKIPGAVIHINKRGQVIVSGSKAPRIVALVNREMQRKQTSEDWVDGHQTLRGGEFSCR